MGIKKNYIFTNKRYSEKSVMSTILGLISLGALIAAVYFTFRAGHGRLRGDRTSCGGFFAGRTDAWHHVKDGKG